MDPFCYSCLVFVLFILPCLFLVALCSPVGKWLPSWFSGICFLFLVTFPLWFSCICFFCFLSLSHMVFWVRYLIVSMSDFCLFPYFVFGKYGSGVNEG